MRWYIFFFVTLLPYLQDMSFWLWCSKLYTNLLPNLEMEKGNAKCSKTFLGKKFSCVLLSSEPSVVFIELWSWAYQIWRPFLVHGVNDSSLISHTVKVPLTFGQKYTSVHLSSANQSLAFILHEELWLAKECTHFHAKILQLCTRWR